MTIKELKKLIKGLPNDMEVMVKEGDLCVSACNGDSGVVMVDFEEDQEEACLMFAPCHHHEDVDNEEIGDKIDLNINLN